MNDTNKNFILILLLCVKYAILSVVVQIWGSKIMLLMNLVFKLLI